jgi:hypothetical protein
MQIELLDPQKWQTRVELANAIFAYLEIFHNRQHRHAALGYRTPIEPELSFTNEPSPPSVSYHNWNPPGRAGHVVIGRDRRGSHSTCPSPPATTKDSPVI